MCFKIPCIRIENNHGTFGFFCQMRYIIGHPFSNSFFSIIRMHDKIIDFNVFSRPQFYAFPKTGQPDTNTVLKNSYLFVIMRNHFLEVGFVLLDSYLWIQLMDDFELGNHFGYSCQLSELHLIYFM